MELVLAAMMVSLVTLAFAGLYGTAQRYLIQETEMAVLQSEVGYAMEHITRTGLPGTAMVVSSGRFYIRYDALGTSDTSDDPWGVYFLDTDNDGSGIYHLKFYSNIQKGGSSPPLSWPPPTGAPPPINTLEQVARRMASFTVTLDATNLVATVTIVTQTGKAPEPARVKFSLSPRSMS